MLSTMFTHFGTRLSLKKKGSTCSQQLQRMPLDQKFDSVLPVILVCIREDGAVWQPGSCVCVHFASLLW